MSLRVAKTGLGLFREEKPRRSTPVRKRPLFGRLARLGAGSDSVVATVLHMVMITSPGGAEWLVILVLLAVPVLLLTGLVLLSRR